MYVNDAFSASHRKHASIVGIPRHLPSYFGFQFRKEVENLTQALNPTKPFFFILGGAKCKTKIPLVKKFLPIADKIFIGGVPANNFFSEMGLETGRSFTESGDFGISELAGNPKIMLPSDVVVKCAGGACVRKRDEVQKDDIISDAGPETVAEILAVARKSSFILWNGPLGNYEDGFDSGTANLLTGLSRVKGITIVGGGDTLTVALKMRLQNGFTFLSTGGGAMLDFLANGSLPGIDAVVRAQ